ncbi:hypothetical protein GCM10009116_19370 [Brevundimonas basaltis]|uniref:Lipoprotein n=1 Tax=Brevundimonas basaltis TaxID=472166 RepID=A0A7W8HVM1_9CAUL|nr:hypothetical protein [Brevundimonas basaltis]MBB5290756.1 hypothetical protein [Brevundimonas basaltis]
MKPLLFLTALVGLAACDSGVETRQDVVPPAERPAPAATATPFAPAGPAATLQPETREGLQDAAAVVRLDELAGQGPLAAKLFGTAGGDPAMNGLYTYIAFFENPSEGWRVFRIGDVLDYRILSQRAGRVDLELDESILDDVSGDIGGRTRRVIVSWPIAADGSPPAEVTVTPAQ